MKGIANDRIGQTPLGYLAYTRLFGKGGVDLLALWLLASEFSTSMLEFRIVESNYPMAIIETDPWKRRLCNLGGRRSRVKLYPAKKQVTPHLPEI